jgi:hypothetical protein
MNEMKWNTMKLITSNTIHSFNFSFPPIWGVCNGMKLYILKNITLLPLFSMSLDMCMPYFFLASGISISVIDMCMPYFFV